MKAFEHLDPIVDYDMWITDTGLYADYLLPDCMAFERYDIILEGNLVARDLCHPQPVTPSNQRLVWDSRVPFVAPFWFDCLRNERETIRAMCLNRAFRENVKRRYRWDGVDVGLFYR